MYCNKCGKEIPDESVFCPECGAKVEKLPPPAVGTCPPAEEVSSGMNIGIIVASLFVPLVGIVMGIIYMRDPNPKKKAAGNTWLWVGIWSFIFWLIVKAC